MMQEHKSLQQEIREEILKKYPSFLKQFNVRAIKNQSIVEAITIDCDGTKLFDDAFNLKHVKHGNQQFFELKVIIANVVPHLNNHIYEKSKQRSGNLYLVSEKFDMLPQNIQDKCNLIKNTVQETFSYNFKINLEQTIFLGIKIQNVKIRQNLTYSYCQKIVQDVHNIFYSQLNALKHLYYILRNQRIARNAVSIRMKQRNILMNQDKITIIQKYPSQFSFMIEQLMTLVNQYTAIFLISQFKLKDIQRPIILVQQQPPEKQKINHFANILKRIINVSVILDLNEQLKRVMSSNIREHYKQLIYLQFVRIFNKSKAYLFYNNENYLSHKHYHQKLYFFASCTSPLRKFQDLYTQLQVYYCLRMHNFNLPIITQSDILYLNSRATMLKNISKHSQNIVTKEFFKRYAEKKNQIIANIIFFDQEKIYVLLLDFKFVESIYYKNLYNLCGYKIQTNPSKCIIQTKCYETPGKYKIITSQFHVDQEIRLIYEFQRHLVKWNIHP